MSERVKTIHLGVLEFQRKRFAEQVASARAWLDELEANPPEPCPMCGHIAWPMVGTQHCWCDSADEFDRP